MKILITGNSGYIGSHLTQMLMTTGHEIYGLDNKPHTIKNHGQYNLDIRRNFELDQSFDVCVHLAGLVNVGESEKKPLDYYITNFNGTMNVMSKVQSSHFIFASTGAAEFCSSVYGTSKRAAEDIVKEYCTVHRKTPYTIFRFYNVIGSTVVAPTNPDGLFYKLIEAKTSGKFTIYGNDYTESWDGTCVRDYVHVNEVCGSIITALDKPSNSIECLGHGVGHTVKEIVNLFCKVNDCNFDVEYGPRRKGDLPRSILENVSPYMTNLYTIEELLKI